MVPRHLIHALLAGILYVSSATGAEVSPRQPAPSISRTNPRGTRSTDLEARTERIVRQIIAKCRRDGVDPEDCLQDVCVDLLSREGCTESEAAHLDAWIAAIGRHKAIDAVRLRSRRPAAELTDAQMDVLSSEANDPIHLADQKESRRAVRVAMKRLKADVSPRSYRVLQLRYFKGLSATETAAKLNLTPAQVWTREHRMKAKLREYLPSPDALFI